MQSDLEKRMDVEIRRLMDDPAIQLSAQVKIAFWDHVHAGASILAALETLGQKFGDANVSQAVTKYHDELESQLSAVRRLPDLVYLVMESARPDTWA
jgi:hypothetical protein